MAHATGESERLAWGWELGGGEVGIGLQGVCLDDERRWGWTVVVSVLCGKFGCTDGGNSVGDDAAMGRSGGGGWGLSLSVTSRCRGGRLGR